MSAHQWGLLYQIDDLTTPDVFGISLMGWFGFFRLIMACYTGSKSSLDLIFGVNSDNETMKE